MAADPAPRQFGVILAWVVRFTRWFHPKDGNRIFVYQSPKVTENLSILLDADFMHPESHPEYLNPGVTCDLFLTSQNLGGEASHLNRALLLKWQAMSKEISLDNLITLLYRYSDFGEQFTQHLHGKFV
jgi:hypothetical protein